MNPGKKHQSGLSLVELMIAITLSSILMLGVIQIFSSSKQTSQVQNALARVQENARYALDILNHEIRMAGQIGCNQQANITNNSGVLSDFNAGIIGLEYDALPATPLLTSVERPGQSDVIENTDVIIIKKASTRSFPVVQSNSTEITLEDNVDGLIKPHDPLIISDCNNADVFIAGDVVNTQVPIGTDKFSKAYADDAELSPLDYHAFYVGDNNGIKNLYRMRVIKFGSSTSARAEPLLEGVEDFQIEYGEDINGDGSLIRYVGATEANMNRVISVRVHLLLSTLENNLASDAQSYWYKGELVAHPDANDRRLFRSFTSTILLRNKDINT